MRAGYQSASCDPNNNVGFEFAALDFLGLCKQHFIYLVPCWDFILHVWLPFSSS